ncbi:MAG: hypothetical protein DYH18_12650 [Xanthomonadales bacterium PRO7]|nr:hypothetical protein [Xanthomonadales bacterium PRO7]
MNRTTRNRLALIGIALVFAIPLAAAFLLRSGGWEPQKTMQSGILVHPAHDVSSASVMLADGSRYAWQDAQYRWTMVLLSGPGCAQNCQARLDEALRMRITLGRNADRLRVLYLGAPLPDGFAAARAPLQIGREDSGAFAFARPAGADELALALVDPRGQLMLRYADGYSAQGLRRDITKILY